MTVEEFLDIVWDEQWVRLTFEDESHDTHIDVWGADWIGGYDGTVDEVRPWLEYEVDDMKVETHKSPETGDDVQMVCVTLFPPKKKGYGNGH
jgi:hypothetical protein